MSYRAIEGDNDYFYATCDRCGIEWRFAQTYLQRIYSTDLCADCRRKPAKAVGPSDDYCTPWQGEVDLDTFAPLNPDGTLYKAGIRICGKADCVRPKHVILSPLEAVTSQSIHEAL